MTYPLCLSELPDFEAYFAEAIRYDIPFWPAFRLLEKLYPEISEQELKDACMKFQYPITIHETRKN